MPSEQLLEESGSPDRTPGPTDRDHSNKTGSRNTRGIRPRAGARPVFACRCRGYSQPLLLRQRHIHSLSLKVRMDYGDRRDQPSPTTKPAAGFHDEVADGPCLIVEIDLIYDSKLAIRSSDQKTSQMRSIRHHCRLCPRGPVQTFV